METPEDIFSMDLKHLPPASAADDKGKIMVYGRQLGWRTVDIREADHFCKFFECTHFTYTPPMVSLGIVLTSRDTLIFTPE